MTVVGELVKTPSVQILVLAQTEVDGRQIRLQMG